MAAREVAEKKMSSSQYVPLIRFIAVVYGRATKSSWSAPLADAPFG
jgi:hypothetical protein